jgi:hypothetical protein
MKTIPTLTQLFAAAATLTAVSCSTFDGGLVKTIDRSKPLENARYWRQVKREPAAFVPVMMARGAPTSPGHGKWITDPQDQTAYFVPNKDCGGLAPGVWEGEARKVTNRMSRDEQIRHNMGIVLIDWPLEATARVVAAYSVAAASAPGAFYCVRANED